MANRDNKTRAGEPQRWLDSFLKTTNTDECVKWPFAINNRYGVIMLDSKKVGVHRVVLDRTIGRPPTAGHQAAHNCGYTECVNPRHLRWATPTENQQDRFIHDTHCRGERNTETKLSDGDVISIFLLATWRTISQQAIGDLFGVTKTNVRHIRNGKTWAWLTSTIRIKNGNFNIASN